MLKFPLDRVRELIAHAKSAPGQAPAAKHRANPEFWKPGAQPNQFGWASLQDVDTSRIKPSLILVKDVGVYLVSAGRPHLPDPDRPTAHKVVYAEGLGPDVDSDRLHDAAGGSDFAEHLEIDGIEPLIADAPGATQLRIKLNKRSISVSVR